MVLKISKISFTDLTKVSWNKKWLSHLSDLLKTVQSKTVINLAFNHKTSYIYVRDRNYPILFFVLSCEKLQQPQIVRPIKFIHNFLCTHKYIKG